MRLSRTASFAALLAAAAIACGGETRTEAASPAQQEKDIIETVTAEAYRQTGAKPSTDTTPCEILSDELIRGSFDLAADVALTRSPSKYSPHPLCTVRWAKPNAAEIEKRRAAEMSDYLQRKLKGEDVKMPSFATENEVSLSLYEPPFKSHDEALQAFDVAMKRLSDGITAKHEDVEMTFQADITPVDGVGRKAMWAPSLHQLSLVEGNRIIHVTVNLGESGEADLEKARSLANDITSRL